MGKLGKIVVFIYVFAAAYILNSVLKIIPIPKNVLSYINIWAQLIVGALLLIGAYTFHFFNTRH